MKKLIWIALGMLVALGLVAGGALTARAVLAQSGGDPAPVFSEWTHGRGPMKGGEQGPLHDYLAQALADKLGLTVDEVNAAMAAGTHPYQLALDNGVAEADIPALLQEVHANALAAAVADGALTQEQADAMAQHMQGRGGFGGRGGMMGGEQGLLHEYMTQALADKLGLTVDEVNAALTAGTNPFQLALDNGVAEADVPALLQEVHSNALAAAVADGTLTQEQADLMAQHMQERGYGNPGDCPMNGDAPQDGTGFRHGPGMMGGGRGRQTNP